MGTRQEQTTVLRASVTGPRWVSSGAGDLTSNQVGRLQGKGCLGLLAEGGGSMGIGAQRLNFYNLSESWFFFFIALFYLLIIFGCTGSLLPHWTLSSCGKLGPPSSCSVGASRCSGFSSALALEHAGFSSVARRSGHPMACGILLDQGSNLGPFHWQADSLPLDHQGNPESRLFSL